MNIDLVVGFNLFFNVIGNDWNYFLIIFYTPFFNLILILKQQKNFNLFNHLNFIYFYIKYYKLKNIKLIYKKNQNQFKNNYFFSLNKKKF